MAQIIHDSEAAFRAKLEDSALLMLETGGILGKAIFKCRKLDYFGDAGDIYFEQPSIALVESGLWSGSAAIPRMVKIEVGSESGEFIDAIRLSFVKTEYMLNHS